MKHKILILTLLLMTGIGFNFNINATVTVGQGTIDVSTFVQSEYNISFSPNNTINGHLTYSKLINTQGFSFVDYFRIYRDISINRIGFNFFINYEDSEGANDFGFLVYPGANSYDEGIVNANFFVTYRYADGSTYQTSLLDYSDSIVSDYRAINNKPYAKINYVEISVDVDFNNFGDGLDIVSIDSIYLSDGLYYPNIFNYEMVLTDPNINSFITTYALVDNGATKADIQYTVTLSSPTHIGILYHTNPNNFITDDRANSTITFTYDNDTTYVTSFLDWSSVDNCSLISSGYCQQIINFDDLPGSPVVKSITFKMRQKELYHVYVSNPAYTSQLYQYMSDILITITGAPHRALFYVDSELYYSIQFNEVFDLPPEPTPPAYYTFSYWSYIDGKPYNNVSMDTFYLDEFNNLNLYAKFTPIGNQPDIPDNPEGTLDNGFGELLDTFNLNNIQGLRIVYVVIALAILLVGLIYFNNVVVIALIQIAWLGLAMFLGIVDLWIVIIIALATLLVLKMKVGD